MLSFVVFGVLAVLISNGVECGYSSASSGSSSNSDGTGHTFTSTDNNGQSQFTQTQHKPGGGFTQQAGNGFGTSTHFGGPGGPPPSGPQQGFGGFNYGPAFPYGPYGNAPVFNPIPQQSFGFNPLPYQPFPFQPYQPFGAFQQPLASPQEFNQYLNGLQSQYAAYYKQQQDFLNNWKNAQLNPGYGNGPNYAYATGAYGPSGIHQTAGVFPQNKNKPNLDTRFDASDAGNSPSNYFGISTSSFSSSSDIDGVKKRKDAATTIINDNGKISAHTVEN